MEKDQGKTALCDQPEAQQTTPLTDSVKADEIRTHTGLAGARLRCTSGQIWVTIEDDPNDYLLSKNKAVLVSGAGKVLVSGQGDYRIIEDGLQEGEAAVEP